MDHVLGAIRAPGQPLEEMYPYRFGIHDAPLTAPSGDFELHASASARRQDMTTACVVGHLATGSPVGLVIQVCQSLMQPDNGVVSFDPLVLPDQYHAVIGVGLGMNLDTGESFILVRNSWGESWGLAGHAWLPIALLDILLVEGFLI